MSKNIMVDPLFKGLTSNQTGFYIFKIENMQLVSVPQEAWGKFYSGDSYLVYSAAPQGTPGGVKVKQGGFRGGKLEQHIHFWLGAETSQDEAAVAAYKSVELDEHLGGTPIQHREVQGEESKRFLSYFKSGVRYLTGGAKTGLSHYVEDKSPKLFQVKGKRKPITTQLKQISWSLMNRGDSYVLEVPELSLIFVWNGAAANRFEKMQAANLAVTLKAEQGGVDVDVVVLEDGEEAMDTEHGLIFQQLLPLEAKAHLADPKTNPDKDDLSARKHIKLYRCSDDEGGKLLLTEVKDGPLQQADLKSDDSFLIQNGTQGIWVWIGKRASETERREAMRNGQGFIKAKNLKPGTPVTRVIDGGEPAEFKSLFDNWRDKDQTRSFIRQGSTATLGRGVAHTVQTKFDAQTLHSSPRVAAQTGMVDDGTGVKEVFRVEMFDLVLVPEEEHGIFFSGDCYVILYAYNDGFRDNYIIYYWLGSKSSQDEQGAAALRTVELDDRLGGTPVQVRVVQGQEPPHFLAIFQGKLTIFQGGKSSAFDGESAMDVGIPDRYLLQVRGTHRLTTKSIQEDYQAASLNTNDCFVLVEPNATRVSVWFGRGSTGDEREMAKLIAHDKTRDPEVIFEGQEPDWFWAALGGRQAYFEQKIQKEENDAMDPRLFCVSNATGNIRVEEIFDFEQADLIEEDVMILDSGNAVFVWFGVYSNKLEQQEGTRIARDYLESCPNSRDEKTPIMIVKQGYEPISFTGHFGSWDEAYWGSVEDLYASNLMPGSQVSAGVINQPAVGQVQPQGSVAYSTLISEKCPEAVNPSRKEDYLSDHEFVQVFGMDREMFQSLPEWKQVHLKKAKRLF